MSGGSPSSIPFVGTQRPRRDAIDLGRPTSFSRYPGHVTKAVARAQRDFLMKKLSVVPKQNLPFPRAKHHAVERYPSPPLRVSSLNLAMPRPMAPVSFSLCEQTNVMNGGGYTLYGPNGEVTPHNSITRQYNIQEWTQLLYDIYRVPTAQDPHGTEISMEEAYGLAVELLERTVD
ncbi:hypothetical protein FRC02_002660 [Tulasnella sp. 418]|nr:hypothetical protein FRC02_002660 [Tulasnella sp. 418]